MSLVTTSTRVSALDIAAKLELPPPTTEQQAVIEAPLTPTLVVAGAGSGKTETMANRVLWLLANGHARPDQILGLTFTRKAAGELSDRINRRITDLDAAGLMPVTIHSGADSDDDGTAGSDLFNTPSVSTYNSFASRLFTDNALLLGREPESVLLSDTSAWLLARRVVIDHGDGRLVPFGKSVDLVTDAVLQLSRSLAENPPAWQSGAPGAPHDLTALADSFVYLPNLPYGNPRKKKPYDSVLDSVAAVAPLPVLAELAARYSSEKRRLGLIEFSDQVALALQVCQKVDAVVGRYRDAYRVVLLDEYQDTSVLQTELLHTLFRDHPVMAVGDPHQSIYGWRGASSANLLGFARDFTTGQFGPVVAAPTMSLSFTWRNPASVLDAANALVAPLSAALRAKPGGIQVETLKVPAQTRPGAVNAFMAQTIAEEAGAVADWFAARLGGEHAQVERSGAMLFRARREMDYFAEVLRAHGVRAHVLGLGGLLSTPEVADVVSVLRVVHDPAAGSELVRLLSGARYRVGARDLQALAGVASWLATHDWAQKAISADLRGKLRASVAGDETSSLVDALDFLGTAPESHSQFAGFSELGRARVQSAGRQLAWLRSRAGLPLLDFVRLIEQEFRLDIELIANEANDLGLANLYSFHDTVSAFLDSDEQGTLASFLRWLRRAELQDDLGPRAELSEQGTVQLLTIHGAKGLEWDFVAIPNLEEKSLPAASRDTSGWLRFGELPYAFRGDRSELPKLEVSGHDTQLDYDLAFQTYKADLATRHDDEERRLIYVATTRAKQQLLLTGSFWGPGSTVRKPSRYLTELGEAGLITAVPDTSAEADKPESAGDGTELWPFDPLGTRRGLVQAAATRVRTSEADAPTRWSHAVTLLLEERALRLAGGGAAPVPTRIPASRFKDYVDDPAGVAAELRRPMPQRPYRATRLGTLFHSWVERRAGGATGTDRIDAQLNELDFGDDDGYAGGTGTLSDLDVPEQEQFAVLQATFERSEWAERRPVDVEIEIHHVLADQVFVCKLDAVYRTETGYQVVDWKTGRAPKNAADLELKQTQLALYRLAYARFKGIDPSLVDAVFYFVADDTIIAPERLYSEADLLAAWSGAIRPERGESESESTSDSDSESMVSPEKL
ncbi:ATP-dependent helicase [Cryobacterium sp. TMT1-3]|uniref:DNA 3'-5' helicase n=1 Tax=Cryobacterium luteum TaxID=1424661 RepID=A0A1H8E274_9MICO|nr:ATP-dependent helicase [Cryobacterium luteum]TFC25505.1 ATP-dependent helicase [Cryobacterium sp. TMT1-3]SEN13572.1 DNA helicase-2 / ATP-dependent DNA helicase PcrA [Cryobacterium luteum]